MVFLFVFVKCGLVAEIKILIRARVLSVFVIVLNKQFHGRGLR